MGGSVFISDLHLAPDSPDIAARQIGRAHV
jgi:hypothetical protein